MPSLRVYRAVTLQRTISLSYHVTIFSSPREDNINVNPKETGHEGVDRIRWRWGPVMVLVNRIMNFRVQWNSGNFLIGPMSVTSQEESAAWSALIVKHTLTHFHFVISNFVFEWSAYLLCVLYGPLFKYRPADCISWSSSMGFLSHSRAMIASLHIPSCTHHVIRHYRL
jgi:hypothetical protein